MVSDSLKGFDLKAEHLKFCLYFRENQKNYLNARLLLQCIEICKTTFMPGFFQVLLSQPPAVCYPTQCHVFFSREQSYSLGQNHLHPLGHHHTHPAVDGLGADVGDDGRQGGGALGGQSNQHADALSMVGQLDEVVP